MKKKLLFLSTTFSLLLLVACASLNRSMYNSQKLAADAVYGAVHGYNQWLSVTTNTLAPDKLSLTLLQRDLVYKHVRDFAAVEKAVTSARLEYAKNASSTNKSAVIALLDTLDSESASIARLVKDLIQEGAK